MKQKIIEFAGVPLVRVAYIDKLWQVQMRDSEDSEDWVIVGNGFKSSAEAVEQAPYLCEF
jgi:hypothetical protein